MGVLHVGCIVLRPRQRKAEACFSSMTLSWGFSQSLLQQTRSFVHHYDAHPCEREISAHIYMRYERMMLKQYQHHYTLEIYYPLCLSFNYLVSKYSSLIRPPFGEVSNAILVIESLCGCWTSVWFASGMNAFRVNFRLSEIFVNARSLQYWDPYLQIPFRQQLTQLDSAPQMVLLPPDIFFLNLEYRQGFPSADSVSRKTIRLLQPFSRLTRSPATVFLGKSQ